MRKPRTNKSKAEAYDKKHQADIEKRLASLFKAPAETKATEKTEATEEAAAEHPATAEQPVQGEQPDKAARFIHRDKIEPNPEQPREYFDEDSLKSLGQSFKTLGQITPIMVRPHPTETGRYQIIAGERRWRAAGPKFGDLEAIRCVVRQADDEEALVLALTENDERDSIRAIERAHAYERLRDFSPGRKMTLTQLGERLGMVPGSVARILNLLKLPESMQKKFDLLQLNEKHGRALLDLLDWPESQSRLWREIERENLSGNASLRRARELKDMAAGTSNAGTSQSQGSASTSRPDSSSAGTSQRTHSSTPPVSYGSGMHRSEDETPTLAHNAAASSDPARVDPLASALQPIIAFAAEGARVLRTITPSADYRRQCLQHIERARELLDEMERELND